MSAGFADLNSSVGPTTSTGSVPSSDGIGGVASGSSARWEMNLSRVILAAYKMDKFLFHSELSNARSQLVKTLSAISSERSAYSKSYPYIVRY